MLKMIYLEKKHILKITVSYIVSAKFINFTMHFDSERQIKELTMLQDILLQRLLYHATRD